MKSTFSVGRPVKKFVKKIFTQRFQIAISAIKKKINNPGWMSNEAHRKTLQPRWLVLTMVNFGYDQN